MKTILLRGGLGNQLFQFSRACEFADEEITLDWCIARPQLEKTQKPALFNFELPDNFKFDKDRNFSSRILRPTAAARGIVSDLFDEKKSIESLSLMSRFRLFTYFQQSYTLRKKNNERICAGYFQVEPRLGKDGKASLDGLRLGFQSQDLTKYQLLAANKAPVIVHMRIGDYEQNSAFGVLGAKYFEEALNKLSKMIPDFESHPIWLFSDSPEKAVLKFPKVHVKQMEIIPLSIETSAELLEIMRLGKFFVISNSSLSWWAAYLSKHQDKIVFAPDPWFKGIRYSKNLIPEDWIKIKNAHQDSIS